MGGGSTFNYSVYNRMPVSLLRLRLMALLEASHSVHLLVGLSWTHDILEHTGTITDLVFPETNVPCPYLQHGSTVNVYFIRGEDVSLAPPVDGTQSSPVILDDPGSDEASTSEDSTSEKVLQAKREATEIQYEPRFFLSKTGMRRGNPNPNHPYNQTPPRAEGSSDDSSRSNASKTGQREEYNLDDLLRDQLAEDALRSSSSRVRSSSSGVRPAEVLSDREHSARRTRQDALFEGYRRIKRLRSC
jgi:hypothetical protein